MRNGLRVRRDKVERVSWSSASTDEKSRALSVLRGCVVLVRHPYERDRHSGAGNCWCGRADNDDLHRVVLDGPSGDPTSQPIDVGPYWAEPSGSAGEEGQQQ